MVRTACAALQKTERDEERDDEREDERDDEREDERDDERDEERAGARQAREDDDVTTPGWRRVWGD